MTAYRCKCFMRKWIGLLAHRHGYVCPDCGARMVLDETAALKELALKPTPDYPPD
jgi:DNA-directed RNA polymerase subunit RPC12/RpoP